MTQDTTPKLTKYDVEEHTRAAYIKGSVTTTNHSSPSKLLHNYPCNSHTPTLRNIALKTFKTQTPPTLKFNLRHRLRSKIIINTSSRPKIINKRTLLPLYVLAVMRQPTHHIMNLPNIPPLRRRHRMHDFPPTLGI